MKNFIKNAFLFIALTSITNISFANKNTDQPEGYSIQVKINKLSQKKAYLTKFEAGKFVKIDSAEIKKGAFNFDGFIPSPTLCYVKFDKGDERIDLFVENSHITVEGKSIEEVVVSGSFTHGQYLDFKAKDNAYDDKLKQVIKDYQAAEKSNDTILMDQLDEKYELEDSLRGLFVEQYIKDNSNSVISAYVLMANMYRYELDKLQELFNGFGKNVVGSTYGTDLNNRIKLLINSSIGKQAPLFVMNDVDGKPISLADFKGNYLLIDFWASWCGPCRAENPNVVKAYEKYHEKGFEILGVSLDKKQDKWVAAIEKDNLTWKHVSDLEGWSNAAAQLYAVNSIPHSVLLDKNGVIIAKNLRGEDLHKKLEEIFSSEK